MIVSENENVVLWSLQTEKAYENLLKKGTLIADTTLTMAYDIQEFKLAYMWLAEVMKKRIGYPPSGVIYPMWAWYSCEGRRKKPDLRKSLYAKKGTKMVVLELNVPKNSFLLTDFILWHYPLNLLYLGNTQEETEKVNEELRSAIGGLFSSEDITNPKSKDSQLALSKCMKSWEKIVIDAKSLNESQTKTHRELQATMWKIDLKDVTKVTHFVAR